MATTVDTLLVRIEADMSDLKRDLRRVSQQTEQATNKMADSFRKVGTALAAVGGVAIFGNFIKSSIQTGAQIEALEVQLTALLGSAEEGARAFQHMARFASRVPFSLRDIQRGSGSLAAASRNADELNELLQVAGNIAAQFGMGFDEASMNLQRALSAGIGAADLFRDKGVSAFAGFQSGVTYSAQQTAKILIETFGTGGTADGAMDQFAKTTSGALSMLGDAVFNFQGAVAQSGLNEAFTELVNATTDLIKQARPLAVLLGRALGVGFSFLAKIVQVVTSNLNLLINAIGIFIALKFGTTVFTLATRFVQLTRVMIINRNVLKAFNTVVKRSPILILATSLAVAVEQLGGMDKALKTLEENFPSVFGGISDSAEAFFNGMGDGLEDFEKMVDGPLRVEFGTGEDAKAAEEELGKLNNIIKANSPEVKQLNSDYEFLSNNLKRFSGTELVAAEEALATLGERIQEQEPLYATFKNNVLQMSESISSAFADMLMSGKMNMDSLKEIFKGFVRTMIAKAIELFVVNRILSMIFPSAFSMTSGGAFIPRATGGSANARQPYLVGERGPEIVVPATASTVVNSNNTRSLMGSGQGATVVQNINVTTGIQQTVRNEIRSLMPEIAANAKNAVADTKRRGGNFGRAFA